MIADYCKNMRYCLSCGDAILSAGKKKYCREECSKAYNDTRFKKAPSGVPRSVGAIGELVACSYFLKRGYEVFRNVSAQGKVDLIIWKDISPQLVEVKVGQLDRETGSIDLDKYEMGIHSPFVTILVVIIPGLKEDDVWVYYRDLKTLYCNDSRVY